MVFCTFSVTIMSVMPGGWPALKLASDERAGLPLGLIARSS